MKVVYDLSPDDCIKDFKFNKRQKDITGQQYGNLKVIGVHSVCERGRLRWVVQCQCGSEYCFAVDPRNLKKGYYVSCPYCKHELASKRTIKHGDSHSRLYYIWKGMKARCHDLDNENYGGRGIKICEEWDSSYESFREWAFSNGYKNDLTIDRIDVNGDYSPENCKWSNTKEQANNKRDTVYLTIFGETKPLSIWSDITGINKSAIYYRLKSPYYKTDEEILYGKNLKYYKEEY